MKKNLKIALFGFLVWLISFVVSFIVYPLRENYYAFFESIMPVAVTITVAFFTLLYFSKVTKNYLNEGILIGIVWLIFSIVIDLLMFMWGPMKMSFSDYAMDIGAVYVIIPVITITTGFLLQDQNKKRST